MLMRGVRVAWYATQDVTAHVSTLASRKHIMMLRHQIIKSRTAHASALSEPRSVSLFTCRLFWAWGIAEWPTTNTPLIIFLPWNVSFKFAVDEKLSFVLNWYYSTSMYVHAYLRILLVLIETNEQKELLCIRFDVCMRKWHHLIVIGRSGMACIGVNTRGWHLYALKARFQLVDLDLV